MGARRPHVFVRREIKAPDRRFLIASFLLKNRGEAPASVAPNAIFFRADWIGDVGFGAVGFDGFLMLKRTEAERRLAASAETELQAGEERTLRYLVAAPPDGEISWSADGKTWKPLAHTDP